MTSLQKWENWAKLFFQDRQKLVKETEINEKY